MHKLVFLDCEFTSLATPELLSIGLVTGELECYSELAGAHLATNSFVVKNVLPQFDRIPHVDPSLKALGNRVAAWLYALKASSIDVCYDYHTDMDLLEAALRAARHWSVLNGVLQATHVGYLLGDDAVKAAMAASWTDSVQSLGVGRHHALADARALQAGFYDMHGA